MREPDRAAREMIRNGLDEVLFVEAGAGSGKTTILVERLVNLIRTGKARADEIAAITFTVKAAAEMAARFRRKLREAADLPGCPAVERERLTAALADVDGCFIGTIHAFCGQLLRKRPVEAGIDPAFTEMDEDESRECLDEFWYRDLRRISRIDPQGYEGIRKFAFRVEELKAAFSSLVANPDVEIVSVMRPEPDQAPAVKAAADWLERMRPFLPPEDPEAKCPFLRLVRDLLRESRLLRLETPLGAYLWLRQFKDVKLTKKWWGRNVPAAEYDLFINTLLPGTVIPAVNAWREYAHPHLVAFLTPAVERFRRERYATGQLNFQDLLMLTARLLRANPEVRAAFSRMYRVLLVDEFQDTDPIQAEIMFLLAAVPGTGEGGWTNVALRPGALFIVGDPKQSIYRFRRADMEMYNFVKQLVTERGGHVVGLTANFRSVPVIGDLVTRVFGSGRFPAAETRHQAAFRPLATCREKVHPDSLGVKRLLIPGGKGVHTGELRQREAAAVVSFILDAVDRGGLEVTGTDGRPRPARWGDFLLLSFFTAGIRHYLPVLDEAGIPYLVDGAKDLAGSESLLILKALLQAIDDGDDRLSLAAVLRSRLFGIRDTALLQWTQGGPADPHLAAALAQIAALRARRTEVTTAGLVREACRQTGLYRLALEIRTGNREAGGLEKYIARIAAAEQGGSRTLRRAVDLLDRMLADVDEDARDLNPVHAGAVRIMNLHKAKGLEAPVVILIDSPHKPRPSRPGMHVRRSGPGAAGFLPIRIAVHAFHSETIAQPAGWDEAEAEELRFIEGERDRLLYVAATRARDLLLVCDAGIEGNGWHPLAVTIPDEHTIKAGETAVVPGPAPAAPARLRDPDEAAREAARCLSRAASPSYADDSPSGLKGTEGAPVPVERHDRGMNWGTVIHALLEYAARGVLDNPLETARDLIARHDDLDPDAAGDAVRLTAQVTASPLWQRAMTAAECLVELPIRIMEPADPAAGVPPVFYNGFIDLVFREEGGWVLVDYKTDQVSAFRAEEQGRSYAPQLALYGRAFTRVTGFTIIEKLVFFVTPGVIVHV